MSEVGMFKLRAPSVKAAPFNEVNDAVVTIATMIGAQSTKVDNATGRAEFTIQPEGQYPEVLSVDVGQIVVKDGDALSVMSQEEFNAAYERY
jgi:hypothetical protein